MQVADEPVPVRLHEAIWLVVTAPVGVVAVPTSLSVMVIVHVVCWPTITVDGTQLTVAVVARLFTVTELLAPRLPE